MNILSLRVISDKLSSSPSSSSLSSSSLATAVRKEEISHQILIVYIIFFLSIQMLLGFQAVFTVGMTIQRFRMAPEAQLKKKIREERKEERRVLQQNSALGKDPPK
jgi:hypothetical protein